MQECSFQQKLVDIDIIFPQCVPLLLLAIVSYNFFKDIKANIKKKLYFIFLPVLWSIYILFDSKYLGIQKIHFLGGLF